MRRLGIFLVISLCLPALCPAATIYVTTGTGALEAPECSLELAIQSANQDTSMGQCETGLGADVIEFMVEGVLTLNADLSVITDDLEINGPGADILTIAGDGMYSIFEFDGVVSSAVRNLTLDQGTSAGVAGCLQAVASEVTLEDLVMTDCEARTGGAVGVTFGSDVTVARSTFTENSGPSGGAIYVSDSNVTIEDSTFDGNFSPDSLGSGGALFLANLATVDIHRSTFDGNRSPHHGGAISIGDATAELTLTSCTVVNNVADVDGSGDGDGGGLYASNGMTTVKNTILASNSDESGAMGAVEPDVSIAGSATVVSQGYNVVGINSGGETVFGFGNPNANRDRVGEDGTPLDPMLGTLGDYGGPTATIPPIPLYPSPVIDQGSCVTETADQRGGTRPVDQSPSNAADGCDIGAFELARIFGNGFESGDTSGWSSEMP